jgi:hypothetical protein
MANIEFVNDYLALHMQADFWSGLEESKKNAACKMAENDICAYLGVSEIDPERIFQLCALSEQAVFLAEHYSEMNTSRKVKSEKIDGVGSREYQHSSISCFSPRALTFLEKEAGVFNISRG